jgi:hypothetical protein
MQETVALRMELKPEGMEGTTRLKGEERAFQAKGTCWKTGSVVGGKPPIGGTEAEQRRKCVRYLFSEQRLGAEGFFKSESL